LECLERYLDKKVEEQKKQKWLDNPERFYQSIVYDKPGIELNADKIYAAFRFIFDELIKKAPSACMGGDDWLDKFFNGAVKELCSGVWCGNERCQDYDGGSAYFCRVGNIPSKCLIWKAWRLGWRSYPDNEHCQKCKHYKPTNEKPSRYTSALQIKQINEYKCYCRAKELPENCPKKPKKSAGKKEK
jgi:hypothetical protein